MINKSISGKEGEAKGGADMAGKERERGLAGGAGHEGEAAETV